MPNESPGLKCLKLHAVILLTNHFLHSNVLCKNSWNPSSIVQEQSRHISSSTDQRKFQPLLLYPSPRTPPPPRSVNPLQMRVWLLQPGGSQKAASTSNRKHLSIRDKSQLWKMFESCLDVRNPSRE